MADVYQKINSIYRIDLIDKNRKTGTDYTFGGTNNDKFIIKGAKLLTTIPDTDLSTIGPANTVNLSNLNLQTPNNETEENVYLKIRPVLRFGSASNEYMYQELEQQELCLHVNSTAQLKLPSDSMIIKTGKVGAGNQTNSVAIHQVSPLGSETIDYQCMVGTHPVNNTHFKVVFEIQLTDGGTDGVSKETFPVSSTNIKVQYAKFETIEVGDLGLGVSPESLHWQTVTAPVSAGTGTNNQTKFTVTIPDLKFDENDFDTEYAFRWKNETDPSNNFSKITTIRILHVDVVEKYVTFVSPIDDTAFVGTPSVEVKLGNIGKDNTEIEQ